MKGLVFLETGTAAYPCMVEDSVRFYTSCNKLNLLLTHARARTDIKTTSRCVCCQSIKHVSIKLRLSLAASFSCPYVFAYIKKMSLTCFSLNKGENIRVSHYCRIVLAVYLHLFRVITVLYRGINYDTSLTPSCRLLVRATRAE